MAFIKNYDHCLCCGSVAVSKVFTCTDFSVSHEQFEIWKCSSCTFRFTQNVPHEEYIGRYYQSSDYISHSDTRKGLINSVYHLVRSITLLLKKRVVKKITGVRQGVLLDVGAGTGAFANKMLQAGWDVEAVEPDETARQNALQNYQLQMKEPAYLETFAAETFDAITLWHVLEHVHHLDDYLKKFREILKPAGKLIVAVPNYTSYDGNVYKQFWAAYDVPRHLYHFSPKSMKALLDRKGFTLEDVKPMWFDSFYVSMLSEKYKRGGNMFRAMWMGLLSNLKAMSDKKKSSSLIYIIGPK